VTTGAKSSLLAWFRCKEPGLVDEISIANLDARIEHAAFRTERIKTFHRCFPPMQAEPGELLPTIDWAQLERQLCSLAGADFERASWEMEVLRASARTNPPEMFYRELLTLAWSLIDGTRPPQPTEDGMD
jgi:hypothetical protein